MRFWVYITRVYHTNFITPKPNEQTSNMSARNQITFIVGPSGSGKSTLQDRLKAEYPDVFCNCVSHTTRAMRAGEVNGVDYWFVEKEEFLTMEENGEFVESVCYAGNHYGMSKSSLHTIVEEDKATMIIVEPNGAREIEAANLDPKPVFMFIAPPSKEEVERRLVSRGTESEKSLKTRMDLYESFMDDTLKGDLYDYFLTNDDLEESYKKFHDFLIEVKIPSYSDGTLTNAEPEDMTEEEVKKEKRAFAIFHEKTNKNYCLFFSDEEREEIEANDLKHAKRMRAVEKGKKRSSSSSYEEDQCCKKQRREEQDLA
ncbi:ORF107 [Haliotid herpesvirus 1]|uniref:Putative guanylate kinase n=1 Tax=Abalone herpesvirus Taiwan/2005 TaxID=1821058 RepID=A0A143DIC6_9VIRU|nr:putative guanylate kinase [Abalone herpesvirus Taiwan/2005]UCX57098.1 ORF107 [Haliotid herpesvirus 1]